MLRDSQASIVSSMDLMGRFTDTREEIQRATAMTKNLRRQEWLADRLEAD